MLAFLDHALLSGKDPGRLRQDARCRRQLVMMAPGRSEPLDPFLRSGEARDAATYQGSRQTYSLPPVFTRQYVYIDESAEGLAGPSARAFVDFTAHRWARSSVFVVVGTFRRKLGVSIIQREYTDR